MLISEITCPVTLVLAPPGVKVIAPLVFMVAAASPTVPPAVLVMSEKPGTSPTVGADVKVASPAC